MLCLITHIPPFVEFALSCVSLGLLPCALPWLETLRPCSYLVRLALDDCLLPTRTTHHHIIRHRDYTLASLPLHHRRQATLLSHQVNNILVNNPVHQPGRQPTHLSASTYPGRDSTTDIIRLSQTVKMCYQLVELYSACRCLYYQHAVDRCAAYGRPGHGVQRRTILVGYACGEHSRGASYTYAEPDYPESTDYRDRESRDYRDSSYTSSSRSHKSSRRHYR